MSKGWVPETCLGLAAEVDRFEDVHRFYIGFVWYTGDRGVQVLALDAPSFPHEEAYGRDLCSVASKLPALMSRALRR